MTAEPWQHLHNSCAFSLANVPEPAFEYRFRIAQLVQAPFDPSGRSS